MENNQTINIAVVVTEGCQASSIHSIVDILLATQYAIAQYRPNERLKIRFKLIGLSDKVQAYNGLNNSPLALPEKMTSPDIVIVPGSLESILPTNKIKRRLKMLEK